MIQYYKDLVEYEGEKLTDEQKKGFDAKIKYLENTIDFNQSFIRYIKPLL